MDFNKKLILAPMAEVNNLAFRLMCKQYGADFIYSEMISANALVRENARTLELTKFLSQEKPFVLQLFGQNTENLVKAAQMYENKVDMIDLNFGCPANKILNQGGGAALLKRPEKIKEIVTTVSSSIKIPVSVKIRTETNYLKIAEICEKAGASAIAVHARTTGQGYSGKADWSKIKKIKENISIPVIGNGDVMSGADADKMLIETKCDSVMIGRGAMGNPYIFKQIKYYLKKGKEMKGKTNMFHEWYTLYKKHCTLNLSEIKMNAQWFTKNLEGSKKLRFAISQVNSVSELEEIMDVIKFKSKD